MSYNSFIYGSSPIERVVSCEVLDDKVELFIEPPNGAPITRTIPYKHWLIGTTQPDNSWQPLEGNNGYKYIKFFDKKSQVWDARTSDKKEYFRPYDDKEAAMQICGFTYFKDMKLSEVSVLAFDIEATGLKHDLSSKVLLISNTFRRGSFTERKLFSYEDYESNGEMLIAWADWVRQVNPAILLGHNIFGYDLPYMDFCAQKDGVKLHLGRNGRPMRIDNYPSRKRKDGSNFINFNNCQVYGREVIDTMFLSLNYDAATRKYESYALKKIIAHEGLERSGRQHYDAALIGKNYRVASEWKKIKEYAEHDADDALALWDLMGSAYFYLNRSIPKSFQSIINGATGSQLNSFLVRSYIAEGHSIPIATEAQEFEGAISIGNPGVYRKVFKVDVASLYPSIMIEYKIGDANKDPLGSFQKTVKFFTEERLSNKAKGKETGDRYYKDVEQAQKIVINSLYGLLGTNGLNFNSPENAGAVTRYGREILGAAIGLASEKNLTLVNGDTDSISVAKPTHWTANEREQFLHDLNARFPAGIRWEDDGLYQSVLVLKAKNYVLRTEDGKIKTKGATVKAPLKAVALKEFIDRLVKSLLDQDGKESQIYHEYVNEILHLTDITRWVSKKTVTPSVLSSSETTQVKIRAAIRGSQYAQGDKIYTYFTKDDTLKLVENWQNDHNHIKLFENLFATLETFWTVLDVKRFPNYALKRNQKLLPSVDNRYNTLLISNV